LSTTEVFYFGVGLVVIMSQHF